MRIAVRMGLATAFALAIALMLPAGSGADWSSLHDDPVSDIEEQWRHDEVMQRLDKLEEHERLRDKRLHDEWAVTIFVSTILVVVVGIKVFGVPRWLTAELELWRRPAPQQPPRPEDGDSIVEEAVFCQHDPVAQGVPGPECASEGLARGTSADPELVQALREKRGY
ncbi:MAG: hypothetical protein HY271_14415 [Deltaproteobacteria bacterium]|nr:hypothetical protein [Deltaproteobacteria bacterium]